MKQLWTIFEFEIMNYAKAKSFVITTVLLCVILLGGSFLPRMFDMSSMLGIETSEEKSIEKIKEKEVRNIGIKEDAGYFTDLELLNQTFLQAGENVSFQKYDDLDDMQKAVENAELEEAFCVVDSGHFQLYVLNSNTQTSVDSAVFQELLSNYYKMEICTENGVEDAAGFMTAINTPVDCDLKVLGKDMESNFWYCYILVIAIFMIIIMYGIMIATSVTTEKSNRAIEVLVTSVDSTYLLFGKVFAGAVSAFVQVAAVLGSALLGYGMNHSYWGDKLDMIFKIPGSVLATFAVFGIGGFLFYAFLYGAMGALVSKTEDINKSAGTLQLVIMIVYFAVLSQLQNVDGMVMKVCSMLPISSYSAMFVRIGMGKVSTVEVVISAIILYASIFAAGFIGAKIYRMGTLRYGNPIKIGKAFKELKNID